MGGGTDYILDANTLRMADFQNVVSVITLNRWMYFSQNLSACSIMSVVKMAVAWCANLMFGEFCVCSSGNSEGNA